MAGSIDTLVSDAMHLPPEQRFTLAQRILSSVEPAPSPEVDAAWDAEIRQRIVLHDTGELKVIASADVFLEADRRLKR